MDGDGDSGSCARDYFVHIEYMCTYMLISLIDDAFLLCLWSASRARPVG